MRVGAVLIVVWLAIGALGAAQRGYYQGPMGSCTKIGTIAITVVTGPLNYLGVDAKLNCTIPQPTE